MTAARELPRASTLAAMLAITALVYLPGIGGPFVFDDFANIVNQRSLHVTELSTSALLNAVEGADAGPLKRPLAILSLALNHYFAGLDPAWYKVTNIAIHCANGALLFVLLNLLLPLVPGIDRGRQQVLALGVTAAWLLHPAQLNSVLYVVQRMSSLSALFVWLALIVYVRARRAQIAGATRATGRLLLGVPLLTAAGVLCKENAILAPVFALVIELSILRWRTAPALGRGALYTFHTAFVLLPALAAVGWLALHPEWLRHAENWRAFSVGERLLSEPRVLWHYLFTGLWPTASNLHFYNDSIVHSRGLLEPVSTVLALLAWAVVAVAAFACRAHHPLFAFGVLWFLAAHLIESSVLMLELVQMHRNYVAWLGPLLLALATLDRLLRARPGLATGAVAVVTVLLAALSLQRAWHWGDQQRLVEAEVRNNSQSAQAHYAAARVDLVAFAVNGARERLERGLARLETANRLNPHFLGAPMARITALGMDRQPITAADMDAVRNSLERNWFELNDLSFLDAFMVCHFERRCEPAPAVVIGVISAVLDNPGLGRRRRASVLAQLGRYYCRVLNDYRACVDVMRDAARLAPAGSVIRLELIEALLLAGRPNAAADRLAAVDPRDYADASPASYLARLREQLAQSRQSNITSPSGANP